MRKTKARPWRIFEEELHEAAPLVHVETDEDRLAASIDEANALTPGSDRITDVTIRRAPARSKWLDMLAMIGLALVIGFALWTHLGAELALVPVSFQLSNPRCTFEDGTSAPGACMFLDEFDGSSLSASWIASDEFEGALQDVANGGNCFRHENVSVSGGNLQLAMTANARASCPQTWTDTAFYDTNFGASGTQGQWPTGQPTAYDLASVNQKTFNFTYGHVTIRMKMSGGVGPGTNVSLFGTACQSASHGVIAESLGGFFAHDTGHGCLGPNLSTNSNEMDAPNFSNASGNLNFAHYVGNSGSPPGPLFTFFGTDFYGALWSNTVIAGSTPFVPNPSISDPSANFHIYETDWRPGLTTFSVDGVEMARNFGAWVISKPMFLLFWNADQSPVTAATLPQIAYVDYVRITCPPGVPCSWSGS